MALETSARSCSTPFATYFSYLHISYTYPTYINRSTSWQFHSYEVKRDLDITLHIAKRTHSLAFSQSSSGWPLCALLCLLPAFCASFDLSPKTSLSSTRTMPSPPALALPAAPPTISGIPGAPPRDVLRNMRGSPRVPTLRAGLLFRPACLTWGP